MLKCLEHTAGNPGKGIFRLCHKLDVYDYKHVWCQYYVVNWWKQNTLPLLYVQTICLQNFLIVIRNQRLRKTLYYGKFRLSSKWKLTLVMNILVWQITPKWSKLLISHVSELAIIDLMFSLLWNPIVSNVMYEQNMILIRTKIVFWFRHL